MRNLPFSYPVIKIFYSYLVVVIEVDLGKWRTQDRFILLAFLFESFFVLDVLDMSWILWIMLYLILKLIHLGLE